MGCVPRLPLVVALRYAAPTPVFVQAHHHQDLHHPHSLSCGVITLGGGKPGTRNIFFFLLYKSIALRLNGQEEQIQQGIRQEVIGI